MDDDSIFAEARCLPTGPARDAYLAEACRDDPDQKQRVEGLLIADDSTNSLLDGISDDPHAESLIGSTIEGGSSRENPQESIGQYRLLALLGEGGMGAVYLAEQTHPVKRRVAVKIIKQGMNSGTFVARFEHERQAIAMMDHPNIAKVLDAGCMSGSHPFFVMELVKGIPITDFCNQNRLSPKERLQLFTKVCNAVQHAHQKGVIHRDLKPSNVLVAMYDNEPVPKVIDFGVAKATHQPLTQKTLCTVPGQIVGTWEYMSPEQAILNQLDVDTRTDIYSLGVILYELLTGQTPLNLKALQPEALEERLRRIREEEPSRPSLKISRVMQTDRQSAGQGALAVYRESDVGSLMKSMRGDLDWIVMRALEKDRSKRYETANGFAAEIQRHLNDEPISFRPPSTWDHLRRTYRRNRGLVQAFGVVVITLCIGVAVTTGLWLYTRTVVADRDNALREWRHELIDRGLEAAFRGDLKSLTESTRKAKDAGAPEDWCLVLEAMGYTFGGDSLKANESLRNALKLNPENGAAITMLAMSRVDNDWNQVEYENAITRLDSRDVSIEYGEFEDLLVGWGYVYIDPRKSVELIDRAKQKRGRAWPIADALYAHAAAHHAIDQGEMALALSAVNAGNDAVSALPRNRFAKSVSAFAHIVAWRIAIANESPNVNELKRKCDQLVTEIDLHPDTLFVCEIVSMYADLTENGNALNAFSRIYNDDWFGACRQAFLYRIGSDRSGFPIDVQARTLEAIASYALLALEGKTEEAMEGYQSVCDVNTAAFGNSHALQIPLLAGKAEFAKDEAERYLLDANGLPDFPFYRAKTRLEYYSGELSESDLLRRVKHSRQGQCYAHYAIGIAHWNTDREKAISSFRKCIETDIFFAPEFFMAKAFLSQLGE